MYSKKSKLKSRTKVKLFDRVHAADELSKLRAVAENVFQACNCDSDGALNLRAGGRPFHSRPIINPAFARLLF